VNRTSENRGRTRGRTWVGAVLATAALVLPTGCGTGGPGGTTVDGEQDVQITIALSRFDPDVITVRRGTAVRFVVTNTDPIEHEFIVGDDALHERHKKGIESSHGDRPGEVTIPIGSTASTRLTFDKAGDVVFACHLPGHLAYGMRGVIRVR